jgi:hypothetical protein
VPSFTPLDPALGAHESALAAADLVVVAAITVGPLNWSHAALLARAPRAASRVLFVDPKGATSRDHTGGHWSALVTDLTRQGARSVADASEAVAFARKEIG